MSASPEPDTRRHPHPLRAGGRLIPLERPLLMGVLNVTPDSFSDGGRYLEQDAAVKHALEMAEEGADLLDVGGESSRPGAEPVPLEEELRRIVPVVREVCRRVLVPVSVDTTKAEVARRALDEGAVIVNDISALRFEPAMARVVAERGAGVVLMHMQGTPRTMQVAPAYGDVVAVVRAFLAERVAAARREGVAEEQILLDPGIGFGKNLEHNLALLARLDELADLGRPLVVGVSRKAFLGRLLDRPAGDRLMGTAAAVAVAVLRGAGIVRVHDVAPMRDVVRVMEAVRQATSRG